VKHGDGLSWGDLFVTAGTVAIKSMGGPVKELCFGRIDDPDGTSSLDLGPNSYQKKVAPCEINGKCSEPLGSTTLGLIYVNPEGPVVKGEDGVWVPDPNPASSVHDVRSAFSRMGMNDTETVALIGGGHAFGHTHSYTSGFIGPWTTTPYKWSNEFFTALKMYAWEKYTSPTGHWQWRTKQRDGAIAKVMRLTTDLALLEDPEYLQIVEEFATDAKILDVAFANAWLKLTTSGGQWSANKKCTVASTGTPPTQAPSQCHSTAGEGWWDRFICDVCNNPNRCTGQCASKCSPSCACNQGRRLLLLDRVV